MVMKETLLSTLIMVALADEILDPQEEKLLLQVAHLLSISEERYDRIKRDETLHSRFSDDKQKRRQGYSHTKRRTWRSHTYEEFKHSDGYPQRKEYEILGCSPSDSFEKIRKNYRKLVLKHHPDRLAVHGHPEEMRTVATAHFRDIQNAYEVIKKFHGKR